MGRPRRLVLLLTAAAVDQRHRVDDLHLPRARRQRQALAGRHHGAALVRRGDGGGRQAVPPRQRLPAPAGLRAALQAEVANTVTGSCEAQKEVEAA
jgi:hypothetical protein